MRKKIKQILVPYDGTKSSERAFNDALNIAKKYEAELKILTCIRDVATFGFFKTKADKKLIEKQKNMATKKIEVLKKNAQKNNVSVKSKIVKADLVSEKIIDYAKSEKVDLIVMSRTKYGTAAEKLHNESTVEKVFHEAPCSFLHVN
ncbi:MAG: universal stress protein [Nitrosopumilaceae archaeon]|nr:universal stress protein [Nitrosopumilaceae archaeon]